MIIDSRLKRVISRGNLTVADLSRWFGRPHATIRGWVSGGRVGLSAPHDREFVLAQLKNLERRIASKAGLPVPIGPRSWRRNYLDRLRNGAKL